MKKNSSKAEIIFKMIDLIKQKFLTLLQQSHYEQK